MASYSKIMDLTNFEIIPSDVSEFSATIPIIINEELSCNDFFVEYISKNRACLIKNVAQNWESYLKWSEAGKPNLEYLLEKYQYSVVTMYDCNKQYYNSQETKECSFKEYIAYWKRYNLHTENKLFYLKDWHLKNQYPNDNFYEVPPYFKSDWLNEYLCENGKDDYRFVYMGPKATWTPLHSDVFKSFSWSVNICGLKRWVLLFPGEELKLKDKLGNLPFDLGQSFKDLKHYEVYQGPGEAVFVPSGWHHQVWNINDTISVNHNWINGCNLKYVYSALCDHLKDVQKEISDCKDMENFDEQCQLILKSTFGMDCKDFVDFIMYIFEARLRVINSAKEDLNQSRFDLNCIKNVLLIINQEDGINNETVSCALDKIENLFNVS